MKKSFAVLVLLGCIAVLIGGCTHRYSFNSPSPKNTTIKVLEKDAEGTSVLAPLNIAYFTEDGSLGDGIPLMIFDELIGRGLWTYGGTLNLYTVGTNSTSGWDGDVFGIQGEETRSFVDIESQITRLEVVSVDPGERAIYVMANGEKMSCILKFKPSPVNGMFYLDGTPTDDGGLEVSYENNLTFRVGPEWQNVFLTFIPKSNFDINIEKRKEPGVTPGTKTKKTTFQGNTGTPKINYGNGTNYYGNNNSNSNNSNSNSNSNGIPDVD